MVRKNLWIGRGMSTRNLETNIEIKGKVFQLAFAIPKPDRPIKIDQIGPDLKTKSMPGLQMI